MASSTDIRMISQDIPKDIARIPTQGPVSNGVSRSVRDRSADEKSRLAKEKEDEYWKSIVPSPCSLGLEELHVDEVIEEIQRRVRKECKYLCLIPSEDFSESNSNGETSKPKRYMEWLRCISNLVTNSLNLDSPNPIGWETHEQSFTLSRLQSGEVAPSYWILGAFCRLRGAQPWQATRSYIASKAYELLEAEGWEHWITSDARWSALESATKPVIVKHLQNSSEDLSTDSILLDDYAHKIWVKFANDHLKTLSGHLAALAPLYSLTENYVKLVGAKLEMLGELQGSHLSSATISTKVMLSQQELRSLVMKRVKKLQYDYFPLMRGGESALESVCEKVVERLHAMSRSVRPEDVANSKLVASILNDLEDQSSYLSTINQLFRVRVCMSDVADPSVASLDASSLLHGSKSSTNESDTKMKGSSGSSNARATKRSITTSDCSSIGHGNKRSKISKTGSSENETCVISTLCALTLTELRGVRCGNCILCCMPDCDRCYSCVENKTTQAQGALRCCIRKMCCKIPTQLKSQPAAELGLPEGWRFTFDDPQKSNLVRLHQIVAPAGLKIISPDGRQYNSLQSAFTNIPHSSAQTSIKLVEAFLRGLGAAQYKSCPGHFLVGKDFSIDFMNDRGTSVTLFGKIVACMKSSTTPSPDVSPDDSTFFILQYQQDVLDAAKNTGTLVPPLQLITAVSAWGGCVAFERKTMCSRSSPKGVIATIDQSTPVETWVTPDMQWEEIVTQPDGIQLPQFTIIVRGYKIVFRAKVSHHQDEKAQYGLFATCSSLKSSRNIENDELNFRPGEMVDLGVCSPLRDEDSKELCVFLAKNYIHSLKSGRWGFLGSDDSMMYDLTDESSGDLHELALTRSLSYTRKCNKTNESPMIHARLDPSGKVHCLFGIPYQGNWTKYENMLMQLVPLFRGQEVEMTSPQNHIQGNNKRFMETKHLQVIRMFQPEDIVSCFNYLVGLIPNATAAKKLTPKVVRRALRVIHCLGIRTRELIDASQELADQNSIHSSFMSNTCIKLQTMKQMLESQMED